MPLHPQCKAILEGIAASGARPFEELSVAEARAQFNAGAERRIALAGPAQEIVRVEDRFIPGRERSTPIRVYWPSNDRNLPALVYFHGGGFVLGGLDTVDRTCRALANAAQCIVVSVDYGLAPEHKFPKPAEEAYQAVKYVASHEHQLGTDPNRIAIGGDSAGGNLAAVVALMSRDRGGPRITFQLLIYPMTDYDDDRPSLHENDGILISVQGIRWFWTNYLDREEDGQNPYVSPLKAKSFSGLPPAMVISAEFDPLRDQGEAYAQKLAEAGVPVSLKRYDGAPHAFFHWSGATDAGKAAVADATDALRNVFQIASPKAAQAI
jgi:acetyl esterase